MNNIDPYTLIFTNIVTIISSYVISFLIGIFFMAMRVFFFFTYEKLNSKFVLINYKQLQIVI